MVHTATKAPRSWNHQAVESFFSGRFTACLLNFEQSRFAFLAESSGVLGLKRGTNPRLLVIGRLRQRGVFLLERTGDFNSESFHFFIQSRSVDPQPYGCSLAIPSIGFECSDENLSLGFQERFVQVFEMFRPTESRLVVIPLAAGRIDL